MATSAQTKLLCHFNGADGATTYTSDDASARTATFYNGAQLSTTQVKFGTTSLRLVSSQANYITFPTSADWAFGTEDFTIDVWVYFTTLPASGGAMYYINQYQDTNNKCGFYITNNAGVYRNTINYKIASTNYFFGNTDSYAITVTTATWYHCAFVRSGGDFLFFWDGTLIGTDTSNPTLSLPNFTGPLSVGGNSSQGNYLNAYEDELRIVKGSAEWTANFTPPTSEYSIMEVLSII